MPSNIRSYIQICRLMDIWSSRPILIRLSPCYSALFFPTNKIWIHFSQKMCSGMISNIWTTPEKIAERSTSIDLFDLSLVKLLGKIAGGRRTGDYHGGRKTSGTGCSWSFPQKLVNWSFDEMSTEYFVLQHSHV